MALRAAAAALRAAAVALRAAARTAAAAPVVLAAVAAAVAVAVMKRMARNETKRGGPRREYAPQKRAAGIVRTAKETAFMVGVICIGARGATTYQGKAGVQ